MDKMFFVQDKLRFFLDKMVLSRTTYSFVQDKNFVLEDKYFFQADGRGIRQIDIKSEKLKF